MNELSQKLTVALPDEKAIWHIFILIALVFMFCQHDLLISKRYMQEGLSTPEEIASSTQEGSLQRQIALLTLAGFAIFSLWRRRPNSLKINGALGWVIIFYIVWSCLSIFWADNLRLTFRRVITLLILAGAGLALAERLTWRQIFLLVIFCGLLNLTIGLGVELSLGTFRPWDSEYRFSGTIDPNVGSWGLGILIIAAAFFAGHADRGRPFFLTILLVALLALVFNKTRTSFGAILIALTIYGALNASLLMGILSAALLSLLLYGAYFLMDDRRLTQVWKVFLMGRDDSTAQSLTGRIPVWHECLSFIGRRPFIGYGYNAFWTERHIYEISDRSDWGVAGVPGALNGYLDIVLGVGLIGLTAYILVIILAFKASVAAYYRTGDQVFFAVIAMLSFYTAVSFLESVPYNIGFATFILFTILAKLAFCDQEQEGMELAYAGS